MTETSSKRQRKHRSRPTPKWIAERQELDEMARRRCLLILSVLSGEKPVSDAITESGLSRGRYYQLEERAIEAMIDALGPTPPGRTPDRSAELAALQAKLDRLEQEKRRAERLLLLTRKVVKKGRVVLPGRGRPPSTKGGAEPSPTSAKVNGSQRVSPSSPTTGGAAAR